MSSLAIRSIGKAASERIMGEGPGRARALVAAVATGAATAALTYRLLRSGQ